MHSLNFASLLVMIVIVLWAILWHTDNLLLSMSTDALIILICISVTLVTPTLTKYFLFEIYYKNMFFVTLYFLNFILMRINYLLLIRRNIPDSCLPCLKYKNYYFLPCFYRSNVNIFQTFSFKTVPLN